MHILEDLPQSKAFWIAVCAAVGFSLAVLVVGIFSGPSALVPKSGRPTTETPVDTFARQFLENYTTKLSKDESQRFAQSFLDTSKKKPPLSKAEQEAFAESFLKASATKTTTTH